MDELLKAIKTRWDATAGNAIRAVATGGLWAVQAPADTSGPYVIYFPLSGNVVNIIDNKIEEAYIQFSIFVTTESGARTCVQLRDLLIALYDDVQLTMSGYDMIRAIRQTSGMLIKDPDEGYMCAVDYMFMYQVSE